MSFNLKPRLLSDILLSRIKDWKWISRVIDRRQVSSNLFVSIFQFDSFEFVYLLFWRVLEIKVECKWPHFNFLNRRTCLISLEWAETCSCFLDHATRWKAKIWYWKRVQVFTTHPTVRSNMWDEVPWDRRYRDDARIVLSYC